MQVNLVVKMEKAPFGMHEWAPEASKKHDTPEKFCSLRFQGESREINQKYCKLLTEFEKIKPTIKFKCNQRTFEKHKFLKSWNSDLLTGAFGLLYSIDERLDAGRGDRGWIVLHVSSFILLSFISRWIVVSGLSEIWRHVLYGRLYWKSVLSFSVKIRFLLKNCKEEMDKMSQVVVVFGGVISGKGHSWHSRPDWSFS